MSQVLEAVSSTDRPVHAVSAPSAARVAEGARRDCPVVAVRRAPRHAESVVMLSERDVLADLIQPAAAAILASAPQPRGMSLR